MSLKIILRPSVLPDSVPFNLENSGWRAVGDPTSLLTKWAEERHLKGMIRPLFQKWMAPRVPLPSEKLYQCVIEATRQPKIYLVCHIPDAWEGRFRALTLCAALVLHQLHLVFPKGTSLAQDFTDCIFAHLDIALRERGVGDLSVPKKMRALAGDFLGCSRAYHAALGIGDKNALNEALRRNIYGVPPGDMEEDVEKLATYVRHVLRHIGEFSPQRWEKGDISFPSFMT